MSVQVLKAQHIPIIPSRCITTVFLLFPVVVQLQVRMYKLNDYQSRGKVPMATQALNPTNAALYQQDWQRLIDSRFNKDCCQSYFFHLSVHELNTCQNHAVVICNDLCGKIARGHRWAFTKSCAPKVRQAGRSPWILFTSTVWTLTSLRIIHSSMSDVENKSYTC